VVVAYLPYYQEIRLEVLRKNTKNLGQDLWAEIRNIPTPGLTGDLIKY
jgi:hypothetical protein